MKTHIKGLELSRAFFDAYGRTLIETEFAPFADRIAAGLVGPGSERYGFDDGVSEDHDFCAGFCLWISEEDDRAFGFALAKAYRKLPETFWGVPTKEKLRGRRIALRRDDRRRFFHAACRQKLRFAFTGGVFVYAGTLSCRRIQRRTVLR